ncbi:ABC transporter permease [Falsiroseomonas sp. CW058]|uniref:ABC transporter permease n=1 Tax=Falsiroseomonas sp. CW058 TaxID=3388664 RepID=UPI003D31C96D
MDPGFLLVQSLSGLATASSLFVIASGLTLVFGVTRIVNFAHGSFYMLGAYVAVTVVPWLLEFDRSPALFFAGVLVSALVVGLLGVAMEVALLRRIYRVPELFQLLATFGVVLIVQDLVVALWGPVDIPGPRAPGLRHGVEIMGQRFPAYDLVLIAIGPALLAALHLLMTRTRFGILIRAATRDREMVAALGVNQAKLFTATLFLGTALAGLGGALQIPRLSASPAMDLSVITEAFVVTVIGGMGSVPGAFLAALLIGQLQAFGVLAFPKITLVLVFLLMAAVLVVRPWGLLGRPEPAGHRVANPEGIWEPRPMGWPARLLLAAAVAALVAVAAFGDDYARKVATEVVVFALAAFSLNFLVGNAGLVSFGHAAWFGAGAYAAALLVTRLGLPMELAIPAAPLLAGVLALAVGSVLVRLSGIYLAMLTLAVAQIAHAVAFQWVELTGGDNGIVGVWPSAWAQSRQAYLMLAAVLALGGIWALWRILHSPFGAVLRAARDAPMRAEAIGVDLRAARRLAFAIAGGAAGLAGGIYAFSKGSIDPTLLSIPMSVDLLAMILLGGIQAVLGPLAGAAALHGIKDLAMPLTDYWRLLLGLAIILMVLAFPRGLAGIGRRR